jgi:hypothetical protein
VVARVDLGRRELDFRLAKGEPHVRHAAPEPSPREPARSREPMKPQGPVKARKPAKPRQPGKPKHPAAKKGTKRRKRGEA